MNAPTGERKLSYAEIRWLAAFAKMDDRSRIEYLDIAERVAKDWPRRVAVKLRVIIGGAA